MKQARRTRGEMAIVKWAELAKLLAKGREYWLRSDGEASGSLSYYFESTSWVVGRSWWFRMANAFAGRHYAYREISRDGEKVTFGSVFANCGVFVCGAGTGK